MTTAIQSQNHNLAIWSAVEKTDPAHTKTFTRAGGFSGTAVNQAYQARRATELFGPIGIGWGFDEIEHQIVEGAGGDKVWFSKVKLWYQHPTGHELGGRRGEVVQWGATTFVGKNSKGLFTDEEAGKKSITDAVGKCLSLLGFSADVYLGQFDDQKYLNDRRREEASKRERARGRGGEGGKAQAEASREASGHGPEKRPPVLLEKTPANGNGHAAAAADPDPDLAAFRDAIAAATLESEAQQAERLLRSQRALAGRPISDVESALIASCTEAACQRIRSARGETESTRKRSPSVPPSLRPSVAPSPPAPDLARVAAAVPNRNGVGPVTGEHLSRPRGSGTAHPHKAGTGDSGLGAREPSVLPNPKPLASSPALPLTPGGLAADVEAFRDFCMQATAVTDVKRGEHMLRSQRLREGIGMGDAESALIAGWADTACRRIRAARGGRSNS